MPQDGMTPKLREDLISLGTRLETVVRTASHVGYEHQASELKGQKGPSYSRAESETKAAEHSAGRIVH